jgi:hypothetical protein
MRDGRYSILPEMKKNAIYILCVLSFLTAAFYNEFNLHKIPQEYIRDGGTVVTNDDASYLNPPRQFLEGNGWGEDYWGGKIGSFIRPPGYGIIYLPLLKMFGEPESVRALKILQYLLFSFSVYWFFSILLMLIRNRSVAFYLSVFYGCSPFVIGFLSYTLTEGLSPSLMLLYVYILFKGFYNADSSVKNKLYLMAAFVFAFIFILRPVLGIFILMLPVFLILDHSGISRIKLSLKVILFVCIAVSFMAVWQVRNYRIAGRYVGLHPVYFEDGNTTYRAPFKAYWNFAGCWAEKGDKGFSYMVPMWETAINGDTSIRYVNNAIDSLPENVVGFFGRSRLEAVFRDYQSAVLYQKSYYDKKLPMPMTQSLIEKKAEDGFNTLSTEFKWEFPFQYYVVSPLKVFVLLAFHSNLSLFIFQETYRGLWWMETLRLICYSIHGLCFLFMLLNMCKIKRNVLNSLVFGWVPFLYIFYLCFVQRGVEERYTLPILPLLMLGLCGSIYYLKEYWKDLRNTR